jgi:hypothetical protein
MLISISTPNNKLPDHEVFVTTVPRCADAPHAAAMKFPRANSNFFCDDRSALINC